MKLRIFFSALIFVGSYLPLSVILLAQDFRYGTIGATVCAQFWRNESGCNVPLNHPKTASAVFAFCLVSFCLTLAAFRFFRPSAPIKIQEVKYIPAELMSYTLPYVVSFMSISYEDTGKLVGFAMFLTWMFWITHKAGQILLNPLLAVFGWRLYEVKYVFVGDSVFHTGRALVQGSIEPEQRFLQIAIQDILFLQPIPIGK